MKKFLFDPRNLAMLLTAVILVVGIKIGQTMYRKGIDMARISSVELTQLEPDLASIMESLDCAPEGTVISHLPVADRLTVSEFRQKYGDDVKVTALRVLKTGTLVQVQVPTTLDFQPSQLGRHSGVDIVSKTEYVLLDGVRLTTCDGLPVNSDWQGE